MSLRFRDTAPANGAYSQALYPPHSKCDVTYWLNKLSSDRNNVMGRSETNMKWSVINTAGKKI